MLFPGSVSFMQMNEAPVAVSKPAVSRLCRRFPTRQSVEPFKAPADLSHKARHNTRGFGKPYYRIDGPGSCLIHSLLSCGSLKTAKNPQVACDYSAVASHNHQVLPNCDQATPDGDLVPFNCELVAPNWS